MAQHLIIMGRQGSGKGTQASHIVEKYGVVHVSTGDMLRAAVADETELGLAAKAIMDSGGLVSDDIINGIVAERFDADDIVAGGSLLDGFPRTPDQAKALLDMLGSRGESIAAVLNLDVPIEEVTSRMMARGREDDTEEAIANRLGLYEDQTAPLLELFGEKGLLVVIDGMGTEDDVFGRLCEVIDARMEPQP